MLEQPFELTKSEANLILDIIHKAICYHSPPEFQTLLEQAKAFVPFSHARYVAAGSVTLGIEKTKRILFKKQ